MQSSTTLNPEMQKLGASVMGQKLSRRPGKIAMIVFGCAIAGGIIYAGVKLGSDLASTHDKRLYEAPKGTEPPPFWIRFLLIGTCTGVSFAHGSNDGRRAWVSPC
jgi:phosphate/sulfate permease